MSDKRYKFFFFISDLQHGVVVKKDLSVRIIQHLLHSSLNDRSSVGTVCILISHSVICQEQSSVDPGNTVPVHDNIYPYGGSAECYGSFADIIQADIMDLSRLIKKS